MHQQLIITATAIVESLIQTAKTQLSCMKARLYRNFRSSTCNFSKLRIIKPKTRNLTPYERHFFETCNTSVANFATKPDGKQLTQAKIVQ